MYVFSSSKSEKFGLRILSKKKYTPVVRSQCTIACCMYPLSIEYVLVPKQTKKKKFRQTQVYPVSLASKLVQHKKNKSISQTTYKTYDTHVNSTVTYIPGTTMQKCTRRKRKYEHESKKMHALRNNYTIDAYVPTFRLHRIQKKRCVSKSGENLVCSLYVLLCVAWTA